MQKILILAMMLIMTVACGHKKDASTFEQALEAQSGHDWSVAKLQTETGKYVVFKDEVTGVYAAYNMDKWDRKNMSTVDDFYKVAVKGVDSVLNLSRTDEWVEDGYSQDVYDYYTVSEEYYDSECDCYYYEDVTYSEYVGTEWVDTSYWYTYYTGGGFRFDNTSGQSKDLETIAALEEETAQKLMAYKFTSEFSMSANRAEELAKLANRYQKLENTRELTTSEKDTFALEALGVSFTQVENALKAKAEGSDAAYDDLLEKASAVNKTTPEQIGKFFDELITDTAE